MTIEWTGRVSTPFVTSGFALIAALIASGLRRSGRMGPMMPYWLRTGTRYVGIAPVITRLCSIDLWQFRSHSAIWSRATAAMKMTRLDMDVPLVTEYVRCAPKTRAA